jgi:hypothetical protein
MSKVNEHFEDPQLKKAVQRVWCAGRAPQGLRDRVEKIVDPSYACRCGRMTAMAITLAAVIAAAGFTWMHSSAPIAFANVSPPENAIAGLIRTHDYCCKAADHHLVPDIAANDFPTIGRKFSSDLKVPVISTALPNWQFAGAGGCPVWGHESAHLLYRSGVQRLSIFSLPAADFALGQAGGDFETTIDGHHLAGFVRDGGLYCVVADSPDGTVTDLQANQLRNELRDDFSQSVVFVTPGRVPQVIPAEVVLLVSNVRHNLPHLPTLATLSPQQWIVYHPTHDGFRY